MLKSAASPLAPPPVLFTKKRMVLLPASTLARTDAELEVVHTDGFPTLLIPS